MQKMILLLALLLSARFCSAQLLIDPVPHATSYMFFAGQLPRAVISPLTSEEREKFKKVYDAVLQGDSTLDAEGDTLSAQMDAYRKKLVAVVAKADPKIAPLLENPSANPLTHAQSDEIRRDQSEAMQGDPNLQSEWDDLKKKMTAHREAVDAAMVKLDPTIEQILTKFSS